MSQAGLFRRSVFTHLPNPVYLRLLGHCATLAVHITTVTSMTRRYRGQLLQDPDVAYFQQYQLRLLTVWNLFTQVGYAALGLSCDVFSLTREGKDSGLLKTLKNIRDTLFSAIVLPVTMGVFVIFWSLFLYEPTIIVPPGVVSVLLPSENFLIHILVVPIALWELVARPRATPADHRLNVALLTAYTIVFVTVTIATYYETGRFLYPIFTKTYGTPYFALFLGVCFVGLLVFYRLQWKITEYLWRKGDAKKVE